MRRSASTSARPVGGGHPAGRRRTAPIQASTSSVSGPSPASEPSPTSSVASTVHRSRIVEIDARRPQPFDEYVGHARPVAVTGALQVPEGGLDIARRKAIVQTPLPGARLLVAGELRRRPAAPVVRVVLEPDAAVRRHRRLRVVRQIEVGPIAPQVFRRGIGPRRVTSPRGRRAGCGGVQPVRRPSLRRSARSAAVKDGGEPRVAVDLLADPAGDPPPQQAVVLRPSARAGRCGRRRASAPGARSGGSCPPGGPAGVRASVAGSPR